MQKIRYCLFIVSIGHCFCCTAGVDTAYVEQYPHKLQVTTFVARNFIEMGEAETSYTPNNPISVGLGVSVKNTIIGLYYGFGSIFIPYGNGGQTEALDFQIHHYGNHVVVDLFIQQYKGFSVVDTGNYFAPNLSVMHYGTEVTYICNGNKFSAKAAFEQTERQRKSVGSWLMSAGVDLTQIRQGQHIFKDWNGNINNLQLVAGGGYAYSWVIKQHWLLSGDMTMGMAVGTDISNISHSKVHLYPAVSARFAASYNKPSWSLAFSGMYKINWLTLSDTKELFTYYGYAQISFVKRFESIRFWKK